MKKIMVALLFMLIPALVIGGNLESDKMKSIESGGYGLSHGAYAGQFQPDTTGFVGVAAFADTIHFLQLLNYRKLDPAASDMSISVEVDTSLGALTDSTTFSLYAVPIFNWKGTRIKDIPLANITAQASFQYKIALAEVVTGTSSESFEASADSLYTFHSTTWWNTAPVAAILYEMIVTASDSFYVEKFDGLRESGY